MKILCLIDSFNVGGAQRQITFLIKSLSQHHDVHVLVYYPFTSFLEDEIKELNIPITKIIKNSKYDIRLVYRILKFIKGNNFDCSISFLDTPNFYNEIAKLVGAVPKIVVSQRSAYFKNITFRKRLLEYFHVFADVIVTNSISQKERMKSYFPFMTKKLVYIPNGYSFENYLIPYQSKNDVFRFIVISNTHNYKNPFMLCRAVVRYKELFGTVNFEVNWFGRISEKRSDMLELNRGLELLKKYNLEDTVKFRGITDQPFMEILNSDVLVHLSDFEGCPNGVCEAMFLKKPVILSSVCDHPYLLYNNGFLVNQKDPNDIAKKMHAMIKSPDSVLKQMGENSRFFIESKMDSKYVAKQWLNILEGFKLNVQ